MIDHKKYQAGFSLVELIVVMFLFSILYALVTISILNVKQKTSLTSTVDTLTTDLKNQQLKAIVGDTEGRTTPDNYGIHFESDQYTLFHNVYSPSDPSNFVVKLGNNTQFSSISFPASQVIFTKLSGEVAGVSGPNTIIIKNTQTGEQKTITVNKYGVITGVD